MSTPVKTTITSGTPQTISPGSNVYFSWGGGINGQTPTTEVASQTNNRLSGILQNLRVYIPTNSLTDTSILTTRFNGIDGNMSVSIGAGATGLFSDTSHTDTLIDGTVWNAKLAVGATGTSIFVNDISAEILSSNNSATMIAAANLATFANNTGNFIIAPHGFGTASPAAEARQQMKVPTNGTFSNMQISVRTAPSSNATMTFRVNATNANQTIAIPSGSTGTFEDTTHSDTVVVGDLISYALAVVGAASGTLYNVGIKFTSNTYGAVPLVAGAATGTVLANITNYINIAGSITASSSETEVYMVAPSNGEISNLSVYPLSNRTGNTTVYSLRINGMNGNVAISVTGGTTGYFTDSTHIDAVTAGDLINIHVAPDPGALLVYNGSSLKYFTYNQLYSNVSTNGTGSVSANNLARGIVSSTIQGISNTTYINEAYGYSSTIMPGTGSVSLSNYVTAVTLLDVMGSGVSLLDNFLYAVSQQAIAGIGGMNTTGAAFSYTQSNVPGEGIYSPSVFAFALGSTGMTGAGSVTFYTGALLQYVYGVMSALGNATVTINDAALIPSIVTSENTSTLTGAVAARISTSTNTAGNANTSVSSFAGAISQILSVGNSVFDPSLLSVVQTDTITGGVSLVSGHSEARVPTHTTIAGTSAVDYQGYILAVSMSGISGLSQAEFDSYRIQFAEALLSVSGVTDVSFYGTYVLLGITVHKRSVVPVMSSRKINTVYRTPNHVDSIDFSRTVIIP